MAVQPNIFLNEYLDPIQESGGGSFSYNPRVEEYEDIANLGIVKQLFDKARRGYGQVDENVFGGLLPGGAATPIGAAFQGVKKERGRPPLSTELTRKTASVIDAISGRIAGAQPVVESIVKGLPGPVRTGLSAGLNQVPFSANLFARYYTGLGNEGLQVPKDITNAISQQLNEPGYKSGVLNDLRNEKEGLMRASKFSLYFPAMSGMAEINSDIKKVEQGIYPYNPYPKRDGGPTSGNNPLTSPATSVGRAWIKPKEGGGFEGTDTYNFMYADADNADKIMSPPGTGPDYLPPSKNQALKAAGYDPYLFPDLQGHVTRAPIVEFLRGVVMQLPDKSFTYDIKK